MHSQRADIVCLHETKSQLSGNLMYQFIYLLLFILTYICVCVFVLVCLWVLLGGWGVGGVPPLFSCFLLMSKHGLTCVVFISCRFD